MNNYIPIIKDLFTLFLCPIPTEILIKLFENRGEALREAICCEIRQGDFSRVDDDDKIAILYRLYQYAMEGVAKNNLRLMCQVIAGARNIPLTAPSFLRYTQILAALSPDEITTLGIMVKYHPLSNDKNRFDRDAEIRKSIGDKVEGIQAALTRTGLVKPSISVGVSQKGNFDTGFNFGKRSAPEYNTYGNIFYDLTVLMEEVMEYTEFNLCARAESAQSE